MQKVLSDNLWSEVKAVAGKSSRRKAAVAYATNDLIGFRRGDVLVTDASVATVTNGGTDAKLLSALCRKGVKLYDCPSLHAKVILLDGVAIIGSGNMSKSSRDTLVEAALMTDSAATVSAVASLIEQLVAQSTVLDGEDLRKLCKIKVVRRGGYGGDAALNRVKISTLGNRTWLVGVIEEDRNLSVGEQRAVNRALSELALEHQKSEGSFEWIRWGKSGAFPSQGKAGDQMIQISRPSGAHAPNIVIKALPVLRLEKVGGNTFVLIEKRKDKNAEMTWEAFKQMMKRLGTRRAFGPGSERILDTDLAESISRIWSSV